MKKIFFVLAFMLIGTSIFANNAKIDTKVNYEEATELIKSSTSYDVIENETFFDCLLTITFIFEDGSSETILVLVTGVSCDELFQ